MLIVEWFRMGGTTMYGILLLSLMVGPVTVVALVLSGVSLFAPDARWLARIGGSVALVACALPLFVGVIGWQLGVSAVESAIELASPEYKDLIREIGHKEARVPLWFGLGASIVLLLPAGGALALALFAPAKEPEAF